MDFPGTVQGAAARRYAGFTYRKPIMAHVDIRQLDPERLHPAHEYPRYVNPAEQQALESVDLADYVVKIGERESGSRVPAQVWMLPNEYTEALLPMLVGEFHVLYQTQWLDVVAEIRWRVFVWKPCPARPARKSLSTLARLVQSMNDRLR